jgi:hypothetical protein
MNLRKADRQSMPAVVFVVSFLFTYGKSACASESDPWTYAHIPLEDSADSTE